MYKNLPQVLDEAFQEELLNHYIKTRDPEVRETLILHNLKLVSSISRKYKQQNNPLREEEDIFNEGVIGLMNSLETYDPDKGSFSHHAATHIRASIGAYVRDKTQGLRVAAGVYETLYKIESFKREFKKHNNREEPTIHDVSQALHIPYKKVEELMSIKQKVASLDIQVSEDGEGTTLGDMLEDMESHFEDDVVSSVFVDEFMNGVDKYLYPEESKILRLSLGLNCREFQMNEVSKIMNIDYQNTERIRNQALRKIRRSGYVAVLERDLDEITSWYSSPRYDTDRVTGGNPDSPVERIVMDRENKRKNMLMKNT